MNLVNCLNHLLYFEELVYDQPFLVFPGCFSNTNTFNIITISLFRVYLIYFSDVYLNIK